MKKYMSLALALIMCVGIFSGCGNKTEIDETIPGKVEESTNNEQTNNEIKNNEEIEIDGTIIELSDEKILINGVTATTEILNGVHVANDIVYYEADKGFTYGEGTKNDEHTKEEADKHVVVHISEPGTYVLNGKLSAGQIAVDLGKEAKTNPEAVVTLVLNGVEITNTVAPGVIFYNVYECYNEATEENATKDVDTSAAGANVIIVDETINTINGSYVARIYKEDSVILSEDGQKVEDAKKAHKYDAAFYSKITMNINGDDNNTGVLNINAKNEGLDSELHLTINGGNINIISGNDGINTNEDGISVTTINGGTLNILVSGETGEGDGIDSNGWLVINGGTVTSQAYGISMDGGIDSDMGIHINGGTLFATGNMLDTIAESEQNFAVFNFDNKQPAGKYAFKNGEDITIVEFDVKNTFDHLIISDTSLIPGDYTLWMDDVQFAGAKVEFIGGMGRPNIGGMTGGQKPVAPPDEFREGMFDGDSVDMLPPVPEDWAVQEVPFPVGGMTTNNDEIPQPPVDMGNNWGHSKDMVGITGSSEKKRPEGASSGSSHQWGEGTTGAGFNPSRGDGFSWGAGSSEVFTTFNITDGANYFVSVKRAVVAE